MSSLIKQIERIIESGDTMPDRTITRIKALIAEDKAHRAEELEGLINRYIVLGRLPTPLADIERNRLKDLIRRKQEELDNV